MADVMRNPETLRNVGEKLAEAIEKLPKVFEDEERDRLALEAAVEKLKTPHKKEMFEKLTALDRTARYKRKVARALVFTLGIGFAGMAARQGEPTETDVPDRTAAVVKKGAPKKSASDNYWSNEAKTEETKKVKDTIWATLASAAFAREDADAQEETPESAAETVHEETELETMARNYAEDLADQIDNTNELDILRSAIRARSESYDRTRGLEGEVSGLLEFHIKLDFVESAYSLEKASQGNKKMLDQAGAMYDLGGQEDDALRIYLQTKNGDRLSEMIADRDNHRLGIDFGPNGEIMSDHLRELLTIVSDKNSDVAKEYAAKTLAEFEARYNQMQAEGKDLSQIMKYLSAVRTAVGPYL